MSNDTEEVYSSNTDSFCDRCEGQVERVFSETELKGADRQIDNGLHVWAQGYYGGFWDSMPFMGEGPTEVTLCHDCCVWLCNEIPAFAESAKGGHGFNGNTQERCCDYAGDWDDPDDPNRQAAESIKAIPKGWLGYEVKEKV
jgi:hypothetical protein